MLSALREYLHRNQTKSTTLCLAESPALPTLPAAAEVAAYRIVQEAINNAVKHAHASEVIIRLTIEGNVEQSREVQQRALCVEIADNGIGISADHTVGIGLHSTARARWSWGALVQLQATKAGRRSWLIYRLSINQLRQTDR